jgi:hypothetical protein
MSASENLREQLAALAHEQWSGWMRYLFGRTWAERNNAGEIGAVIIAKSDAERWMRQMETPYAELPEEEKESDRVEADKVLALIGNFGQLRATLARADWALRFCEQLPDESIAAVRQEIAALVSLLPAPPLAPAPPPDSAPSAPAPTAR